MMTDDDAGGGEGDGDFRMKSFVNDPLWLIYICQTELRSKRYIMN